MTQWYLQRDDGTPTEPCSTERVLASVRAGRVPLNAQTCRVGEQRWQPVSAFPELVVAAPDGTTASKACPYCAETILAAAIRCKHCQADLCSEVPAAGGAVQTSHADAPGTRQVSKLRQRISVVGLSLLLLLLPVLLIVNWMKSPASAPTVAPAATRLLSDVKAKQIPQDISAFFAWAEEARRAIRKGPKAAESHLVLGRITCRTDKEFDDFGYCSSSKEGDPRYAAEWPQRDPTVWSAHMMRTPAAAWIDCSVIGKPSVRKSNRPRVFAHQCRYSDTEDAWLKHFAPPGGPGNSQMYVYSRDFPQKDGTPYLSPRPTLYRDLAK